MNSSHVEASLARIRAIFEKASDRIEALAPGEKITATGLAADLAEEIGMKGPSLYPTLKFLYEGYPGVSVTRGAHGGIMKLPVSSPSDSKDDSAGDADTAPPSASD